MFAFFSFVTVMSLTPGPNTLMAMLAGQTRGFKRAWALNLGMASGMAAIGVVAGLAAGWLQHAPRLLVAMRLVGSLYLLYLAYHVALSRPTQSGAAGSGFWSGVLLQLTNVKVYLYFVTGLGAFALANSLAHLPLRWAVMVLAGSLGTLAWTLGGQLLNRVYAHHYRLINLVVAGLLVFSAIDLWR